MFGKLKLRAGMDPTKGTNGAGGPLRGESHAVSSVPTKLQKAAFWTIIVAALLTFAAAINASPFPHGTPRLAWMLHPVMLALGFAGGLLSIARAREIDVERWRIVSDPALTSGERAWAHKEAERQMRSAATVFLMAGAAIGAWLAYQTRIPMEITAADLLVATPVLGFGIGLFVGNRRYPKIKPEI